MFNLCSNCEKCSTNLPTLKFVDSILFIIPPNLYARPRINPRNVIPIPKKGIISIQVGLCKTPKDFNVAQNNINTAPAKATIS